jgi:hypothetical protein
VLEHDQPIARRAIRLFVSHRSHSKEAQQRLDAIAKVLQPNGIEVIYDKEQIKDGRRWREVINAMLVACDAAAILLTPSALESEWVLKEATILRWRHDRDDRFPLLPVLLDGLDVDTLMKNRLWDPVDLPALQAVAGDAAAVAASLEATIAPLEAQLMATPLDILVGDIAAKLSPYTEQRLQLALGAIGEEVPTDVIDQPNRLAHAIARWMLRQPPPALARIAAALTKLGTALQSCDAVDIISLVAPLWVELDAASAFARHPDETAPRRDLAMACARPGETVKQYVARAYYPDNPPKLVLLSGLTAGAQEQDVRAELAAQLAPGLKRLYKRPFGTGEVDAWLANLTTRMFVVMPLPSDASVVAALQSRYRQLTFVFFSSPSDVGATEGVPSGVVRVEPSLAPSVEDDVLADLDNALANFLELAE